MARKPGFWKTVVRICSDDKESVSSPRHKFHEVFQPKQGCYSELPSSKISEMMKSNTLDNAPTQLLLNVVNGIIDESIERKSGEIPDNLACLLRKVVQEIERRISKQADHIRNQNTLYKAREQKYESRIRVLEALATVINKEAQDAEVGTSAAASLGSHDGSGTMNPNSPFNLNKHPKIQIEEKKKQEQDLDRVIREKEDSDILVAKLRKEIEIKNQSHEQHCLQLEKMIKEAKAELEDEVKKKMSDKKEETDCLLEELKERNKELLFELEEKRKKVDKKNEEEKLLLKELKEGNEELELQLNEKKKELDEKKQETEYVLEDLNKRIKVMEFELEEKRKELDRRNGQDNFLLKELNKKNEELELMLNKKKMELDEKKQETDCILENLNKRIKEMEFKLHKKNEETNALLEELNKRNEEKEFLETRIKQLEEKENIYKNFTCLHTQALQDLKSVSESIKSEVLHTERVWNEEYTFLEKKYKEVAGAAEICHLVLEENKKFYNELQELKGNIRVYCRIRPFMSVKDVKVTTIDYIGENGELLVANPSKQGKDGHRMFKFNKVFGPAATQEEVYLDTQPLIRSVLDGYNICIFAYGQTGSGKTYTMSGPDALTKETWGVNYRALNDLFHISETRRNTFMYEVEVQMVEIYNEQVRDLLANDGQQKRLEIRNTSQPNGLAVPGASVRPVNSTSDVIELMQYGQSNRAASATALNERSSRSHSVLTVHVQGMDLKAKASSRGCLHLIDLAGSERIDRSEVTGDRLKEAQHINKSLSALGDVISALAQKSSHVPYRNSKLTQLLQSSLGGHAKTLMFVQINSDLESYSETLSTLKFAERVAGVELGAARSNKESKDVRELMEQVASLKDTITRKDEEIEQLHLIKEIRSQTSHLDGEKHASSSLCHSVSSSSVSSQGEFNQIQNVSGERNLGDNLELLKSSDQSHAEKATSDVEVLEFHGSTGAIKSKTSPTERERLATSTRTKTNESLKKPLYPRKAIKTTSPSKSSKRWQ